MLLKFCQKSLFTSLSSILYYFFLSLNLGLSWLFFKAHCNSNSGHIVFQLLFRNGIPDLPSTTVSLYLRWCCSLALCLSRVEGWLHRHQQAPIDVGFEKIVHPLSPHIFFAVCVIVVLPFSPRATPTARMIFLVLVNSARKCRTFEAVY